MSFTRVPAEASKAELEIVVTRANGTVERHGTVAYYNKNRFANWLGNRLVKIRSLINKRRFK